MLSFVFILFKNQSIAFRLWFYLSLVLIFNHLDIIYTLRYEAWLPIERMEHIPNGCGSV